MLEIDLFNKTHAPSIWAVIDGAECDNAIVRFTEAKFLQFGIKVLFIFLKFIYYNNFGAYYSRFQNPKCSPSMMLLCEMVRLTII